MTIFDRIFGDRRQRARLAPLYQAVVREGRRPFWYRDGRVPDTVDGRFEMIAAILSLVLIRLEAEGEARRSETALLTELFIDDMDSSLRQIGIGDFVVGKHVGKMMGALGGRLGALREALAGGPALDEPVRRNVFREAAPSEEAVRLVAGELRRLHDLLAKTPAEPILAGELPAL